MKFQKFVINITDKEPDPAVVSILIIGLNYPHTPNPKPTIREVFRGVENATRPLPTD
jgi:hypothetical protein